MKRLWVAIVNISLVGALAFASHVATQTANAAISGCNPATFAKVSDGLLGLPDNYNSSALCNGGVTADIQERNLVFDDADCPAGSTATVIRVAKDEWGLSPQKDNSTILRWLVRLPADMRMEVSKGTSTSISVGVGVRFEKGPFNLDSSVTHEYEFGTTSRWNFNEKRTPGSGGGLAPGLPYAQTYVASIVDTRYWRYYQEICVNWSTKKVTEIQKAANAEYYRSTTLTPLWRAVLTAQVKENAHYLQPNVNGQFYPISKVKECTGTEAVSRQWTLSKGNSSLFDKWVKSSVTFGISSGAGPVNMNIATSGSTLWTLSMSNGGAPKTVTEAFPASSYMRYICSVVGDTVNNKGTFENLRGTGWDAGRGNATVPPFGMVIGVTTRP